MGLKSSWLESLGLKSPGLKCHLSRRLKDISKLCYRGLIWLGRLPLQTIFDDVTELALFVIEIPLNFRFYSLFDVVLRIALQRQTVENF